MNQAQDRELLVTECPKPIRAPRRNDTLARVVADYIKHRRRRARKERTHFAKLRLREAVRLAGLAQTKESASRTSGVSPRLRSAVRPTDCRTHCRI